MRNPPSARGSDSCLDRIGARVRHLRGGPPLALGQGEHMKRTRKRAKRRKVAKPSTTAKRPRSTRAKKPGSTTKDRGLSPEAWDRIERFGKLLVSSLEPISKLIDAISKLLH